MIRSKTGISLEITLNVLIISLVPLKFLYTLTTASFLFFLVGTLSVHEFAMVPGVYPSGVYCDPREKRYTLFPTHSAAQLSK